MKGLKLFHSSYTENDTWEDIIYGLEKLGYVTHSTIQPHDRAIVLGGYWENPNAFNHPILFYRQTVPYIHEFMTEVLKEYYDILINLTGVTINEAIEEIDAVCKNYT